MRRFLSVSFAGALCAGLFQLWAGPPLICFPFDIGSAESLPWASAQKGWDNPDPSYDTNHLAADTLRILDSGAPVLVRMETLRRAIIYGDKNHRAAADLFTNLRQRASSPRAGTSDYFDYGYAVATMKQMLWKYKEDLTGGADGYSYVLKALAMDPASAEMHFAAAMIARDPRRSDYAEHAAKALAARSNALLAANVDSHLR